VPKDVSRPDWACQICGTRFGRNLDAAQRCEDAGVPEVLPDGAVYLDYTPGGAFDHPGFTLTRLHPQQAIRTRASAHEPSRSGHLATYRVGETRRDRSDQVIDADAVTPHRPGALNRHTRLARELGGVSRPDLMPRTWAAAALGLSRPGAPVEATPYLWRARPLTGPVMAVLDALDARIRAASGQIEGRLRYDPTGAQGAAAAEAARTRDGVVDLNGARWQLHGNDPVAVAEQMNTRWTAWRSGAPIEVPLPRLSCPLSARDGRQLSASKLPRALREQVDATGVPWPTRTNATEYANHLIQTLLGYKMDSTEVLFHTAKQLVAVYGGKGGVGKSHVAEIAARRCARRGLRTGIVDCDLNGPSQASQLHLGPALVDQATGRIALSPTDEPGLFAFSPAQVFDPAEAIAWDDRATGQWLSLIGSKLDLDAIDVLFFDLPPGHHPVYDVLFDRHRVKLTGAIHVTTGQATALEDSQRSLTRLAKSDRQPPRDRHVLVENLARAVGPTAGGELVEIRLAGAEADTAELAARNGLIWGGSLPWGSAAELADCPEIDAVLTELGVGQNLAAAPSS
jgi:ATP-binding protein involved in chromosome partitioning